MSGSQPFKLLDPGFVENRFVGLFWSFGFSLFKFGQFPKSVSMFGWIGLSVHEQVDVVRPVFEIIEWFEVVEVVHELIKILIELGLGWLKSPNVSMFR